LETYRRTRSIGVTPAANRIIREILLSMLIVIPDTNVPMDATITFPRSLLSAIKVKEADLNRFVRQALAVELYREGRLSLGKAAELAGARNKWEMILLLNEKGVPVDYSADDAMHDRETLRTHLRR
jgi:predicted HTH domain antitoxin